MANNKFLSAAIAGVAAFTIAGPAIAIDVKCWGIQGCKGQVGCGVGKDDIEAVKRHLGEKDFKEKYSHASTHECGHENKCSAKTGHLGWVKSATEKECFDKGGFVIDKVGNAKKVRNKPV